VNAEDEPYLRRDGDLFVPTNAARGGWNPNFLNGRVVVGLLGHAIDQRHGDPEYLPARLTVDMYRLPDLSPIEVKTRIVRDGFRIKVIDADFLSGGVTTARATCQLLRRTENPRGNVWTPPNWTVPEPAGIGPPQGRRSGAAPVWEMRPIIGAIGTVGSRRTWTSDIRDLVDGAPLTPFSRVALAADFASPYANAGDAGLGFINTDVTVYLHRLPLTKWIGFEVVNHGATDGIAIGECFLYDETGPIGSASVAALAQKQTHQFGGAA